MTKPAKPCGVSLLVLTVLVGCSVDPGSAPGPVARTEDGVFVRSDNVAIPGFTSISYALNPSGRGRRFDIGGGNGTGDELDDVPWQRLRPGDVVNIYHRATPYRHKILLSEQGTARNPIVINGVTDADGNRPTLDAANAVSVNPNEWDSDYASTLILINKRHVTGRYGHNAKHYRIQNLRLTGARPPNSFTHHGEQLPYVNGSRAIWSAGGQYFVLQGMVIDNNGSGVFVQANDDPGSLSKAWTIRGSKFESNGHGARDHQIYLQAVSDPAELNIVEGNFFGPPRLGQSSVAQLKVRSTGVVIRYNYFNSSHRTLDIVEAQDAIPDWMYSHYSEQEILDWYRSSYIYGNVFVTDHAATTGQVASRPLHFGADSFEHDALFTTHGSAYGQPGMRGFGSPTYFYHNTFFMQADSEDTYRGTLFDAENNNSVGSTPTPGTVEAWNNIIEFAGNTRIAVMNRSGATHWQGTNLLHTRSLTVFAESDDFANTENRQDDPAVDLLYGGAIIEQAAGFVDAVNPSLAAKDFSLTEGSAARERAVPLPSSLAMLPVLLQPNGQHGGAVQRPTLNDLGAIEYQSSAILSDSFDGGREALDRPN